MKLGLVSLVAILLTGCSLFGGSKSQVQEAYYVPVITSDRHASSSPQVSPVHRTDARLDRSQSDYVPVVVE